VWLAKARSLFTRSKSILFNDAIRNHLVREAMTAQDQRQLDSIANIKSMLVENQFGENPDFNAIHAGLIRANEALIQLQKRYQVNNLTTVKLPHYIDYVEADDHIYSYAQLNGRTQFVRLGPRQEFDSLKRRFDHYILLKELSQDDSIGLQLYQFLVSPLSQKLPARVTIIPDGDIGLIPFDMLEVDKGEMVLEHSIVSYQFQFEPYAATGDRKSHPFRIYCLAPTYPKKDPLFAGTERGSVYQLPFARQEADTIKTIFGQSVIVSTQGDKAQCKEQMISSNVFHFSGHAIVNASNAFLALTDDGDIRHQLIDDEIALMQCPMDLAVLSACETGLGKMEYGEGIRSLGRSFLEAGASAAIYSLWTVNDKSTSAIMAGLYKNLHKGKPKDEALRQAKLDFIHTASVAMPHPYYWAGFVATGDMRPVRNRSIAMLIFMGIVVLTGVGIGITNMIRRAAVKSGSTAA
ncbi:MAG TPA: CHAT domain-containing protein, partial [Saprospiraceae bacterium]|nr:CHAT domain-containing protein [Saprospiraceae bacterium]